MVAKGLHNLCSRAIGLPGYESACSLVLAPDLAKWAGFLRIDDLPGATETVNTSHGLPFVQRPMSEAPYDICHSSLVLYCYIASHVDHIKGVTQMIRPDHTAQLNLSFPPTAKAVTSNLASSHPSLRHTVRAGLSLVLAYRSSRLAYQKPTVSHPMVAS